MNQSSQTDSENGLEEKSQVRDLIFSNDGSGKVWQEGWYIYQDGKIQGPLGLMEALTRPYFGTDQQAVLISRRGYEQWYELSFLAPKIAPKNYPGRAELSQERADKLDIMRTRSSPGSLAKKNPLPIDLFESQSDTQPISIIEKETLNKKIDEDETQQYLENKVLHDSNKKILSTGKHPSFTPSLVKPIFPPKSPDQGKSLDPTPESNMLASRTAADLAYQDYTLAVVPSVHNSKGAKDEGELRGHERNKADIPPTKGEVIQEYFISRKKLRLGNIRSALIFGAIGYIGSLGLIWGIWLIQSLREIEYHCEGKSKTSWGLALIANIPGLHLVFAWILADKIAKMQRQNRYQTIKKPMATFLAIFPPACVTYLQKAINEHWLLHAKSALIKQGT